VTCSIDDCTRPVFARSWCSRHWGRWRRNGDPNTVTKIYGKTPVERAMHYVQKGAECWEWVGSRDRMGYGRISVSGIPVLAHRLVYEAHRGDIPEGLELDHLCFNRGCVNPDHLDPVTHKVNMQRMWARKRESA
jgi:hypothetical protein